MYFFNYIYFLIITVAGIKFLFTKQAILTHPLDKKKKILLDGPELFLVLTFSTGLLAFSAPGMLDLMAIRLMILEIFLLVGLFIVKRKPQWNIAVILYMIYNMANYRIELYFICKLWISRHIKIQLSSAGYAFCFSSSKG